MGQLSPTEPDQITDLSEQMEFDIICDFSESPHCPKEAAAWVMHTVPCSCGNAGIRLSCTPCKDLRVETEGGVKCESCGFVTVPARLAYCLIEPLRK